ncbi:hypothetical protein EBR43_08545 [bacterium]|nr:hypothetical protein [bacterium]
MAGNYPFHGKLHRSTHHTNPTPGILESGTDPLAGPNSKFQGVFYTQSEGTSLDWYGSYLTLQANSGYWVSTYTTVRTSSSDWESVYATVQTFSASWEESVFIDEIAAASGRWNSTYTTVYGNSSYWKESYSNLVVNSAAYLAAVSSVAYDPITSPNVFYAKRIQALDLNVTPATVQAALSALHERVNALYVLFAGLTANQSTVIVSITSNRW